MRPNISSKVRRELWSEAQRWRDAGGRPRFFWRDDDLAKWSPALDVCLQVANERHLHVAFAAIPTQLTQRAAAAVLEAPRGRLAVHGYAHKNHAAVGESPSEYPGERAPSAVLAELRDGAALLEYKAGDRFLNLFVPPWGRFDASFDLLLKKAGVACFSGNSLSPRHTVPLQLDCHVLAEHGRSALELDVIVQKITRLLQRRGAPGDVAPPLGLMTHHRTFEPAIVETLRALLDLLIEAGVSFSDFSEVDALSAPRRADLIAHQGPSRQPLHSAEDASAALRVLGTRTLPRPHEGYPGLDRVLTLLAGMSPVAILRFTHMHELARRLPASATIMSAGCGTAVAEVALAMMHPRQRWVAVDADGERFRKMRLFAEEGDVSNITFGTLDLNGFDAEGSSVISPRRFDAIVMVEVMVYLEDPGATLRALSELLVLGGELCCIEPFAPDDIDETALSKLRRHTQSRHGGFSHRKMRDFVEESSQLELLTLYNCYQTQVHAIVEPMWRQLGAAPAPALLDLAFAAAQLDLHGGLTGSRREATAVALRARAL